MQFTFTTEEESFRHQIRDFLAANTVAAESSEDKPDRVLERALAKHGWLTLAWPVEYGGLGASHMQQLIFKEELARVGGSFDFLGINLAGPTIMMHGSDAMKREQLPRIAKAEVRWCQGFSEPNAGSDLASLQTRAVRDGDEFVINGQKVWTSGAHLADWILLLTRTDPEAPKHRGITMFAVDMKTPGITVRPLVQMTGVPGFNEVYFEDVHVPATNMISELNRGWYAATTTLDFERSGIERNLTARNDLDRLDAWLADGGLASMNGRPSAWRNKLADLHIECEVGMWLARRVAYMQGHGLVPNYESSMSKTFNSELGQRVADFGVSLTGMGGQVRNGPGAAIGGLPAFRYLDSRRLTIGQGTSEINRNIIATRGLGLPRG